MTREVSPTMAGIRRTTIETTPREAASREGSSRASDLPSTPVHPWLRYVRLRSPIWSSRHGPRQAFLSNEQRTENTSNDSCTEALRPADSGQAQHEIVLSPIGKL